MRYWLCILLIMSASAEAQLPRNALDQYEFTQEITLNAPDSILKKRSRSFLCRPLSCIGIQWLL